MPSTKILPILLPYRDAHSTAVKYTALPTSSYNPSISSSSSHRLYTTSLPYDSDNEPLIASTIIPPTLNEYDLSHFTATGRPLPAYKSSSLASLGGHMYTAPQLLPQRYTDDSIIPAIIVDVIPSPNLHPPKSKSRSRKSSLLGKLRPSLKGKEDSDDGSGNGKGIMKVAFMPRREYLKFFARGLEGEYIGSEPYKRWTEQELEVEFGKYRPDFITKKRRRKS